MRRTVRVSLFGPFSIEDGSGKSEMPLGKPSDLIKLAILCGGQVHVEQAIDALWPEADIDSGRRRLRNVLSRARTMIGNENLIRRGDLLVLSEAVVSDFFEFRRAAAAAAAAERESPEFLEAAKHAVELAQRGFLPADTFAEWASADRWNVESIAANLTSDTADHLTGHSRLEWLGSDHQ